VIPPGVAFVECLSRVYSESLFRAESTAARGRGE
jgi:hypothetical protein